MPKTRIGDLDVAWDVAGPADGAPVLMINGLGAVRGSWHLQVAALSERYRVYSYDNRDVGETGAGANPAPCATDRTSSGSRQANLFPTTYALARCSWTRDP